MHLLLAWALLATSAGHVVAQALPQPLPARIADVRWNAGSTVFGDFTCQGQQDMAMYGTSESSGFVVMIRPAAKNAKPSYMIFATRGRDPKSLQLKVESLDFDRDQDFKKELEAAAPGLVSSKSCKGLSFGDGETDSHHIYWHREEKAFRSWSL